MPSPSKAKLLSGLAITSAFFIMGAYAASAIGSDVAPEQAQAHRGGYTAAPVPRAVDPRVKQAPSEASKAANVKVATSDKKPKNVADVQPATPISTNKDMPKESETVTQQALTLSITGIRSDYGNVLIMVFPDAASYDSLDYNSAVGYVELKAQTGTLKTVFPELNDGPYAVSLFHDENGDHQFNMSGEYPIEGYGTSNAKGKYDTPSFENASVMAGFVTIKVHYLQ